MFTETYRKTKYFDLFGKTIFKITEICTQVEEDEFCDEILVNDDYFNREFDIDD